MSAPTEAVKAALAKVPTPVRKTLRSTLVAQCGGDWTRVQVNPDGSFVVRNGGAPPVARKRAAPASRAGTARAPRPVAPAPVPPKETPSRRGRCTFLKDNGERCIVMLDSTIDGRCALHDGSAFGKRVERIIEPGVNVRLTRGANVEEAVARDARRLGSVQTKGETFVSVPDPAALLWDNYDWPNIDMEPVAAKLRTLFRHGYPANARPVTYYPDLLASDGLGVEEVDGRLCVPTAEAALMEPDHVEVRPESKDKGYPVLGFWRGDVLAVLGMRIPSSPQVIAVYYLSHSMHDTHRVQRHGGAGGSRKTGGLPRNPKQAIQALRLMGATVEWDELSSANVAPVTYQGQDLGKISVGAVRRDDVERDYQRTIRKMQAINRRLQAAG